MVFNDNQYFVEGTENPYGPIISELIQIEGMTTPELSLDEQLLLNVNLKEIVSQELAASSSQNEGQEFNSQIIASAM
jgi:hypothetical protein